jgi:molybdopterin-guanine dinucleotide biosynthesis protein A
LSDLAALILMGGKSSRMQEDKAKIVYHEKAQFEHLYDLLKLFCEDVYLSTNQEYKSFPFIKDNPEFGEIGPMNGILSGFDRLKTSLLVIAIDYPLFSEEEIQNLISQRDKNALASVMFNQKSEFFEPFLGIYEFSMFEILKTEIKIGNYSLQAILAKNEVKKVFPLTVNSLRNCNTIEEKNQLILEIHGRK